MIYKTIDEAIPMIKAIEALTSTSIEYSSVDLNTIGDLFKKELYSLTIEARKKAGFYYLLNHKADYLDIVGKWAFFSDIAVQKTTEYAFGFIVGARKSNDSFGWKYFVSNDGSGKSICEFSNTSPMFIDIDVDARHNINLNFTKNELFLCSNYLNAYCSFFDSNGNVTSGYCNSFNHQYISITDFNDVVHKILFSELNDKLIHSSDDYNKLLFSK